MLTQGEILRNRYKVIRQLGQGGMGAVYEAHDNVFDTSVALKQVMINLSSAYDTKAQEMAQLAFEREAKILARVNHENIPHVKDYFTEDDAQFLVMELVDGDDLGKLLMQRRSPFPVATIIEWTDRILDALDIDEEDFNLVLDLLGTLKLKPVPKGDSSPIQYDTIVPDFIVTQQDSTLNVTLYKEKGSSLKNR